MKTNKTNLTLDGTAVGLNDGDVDGLVYGLVDGGMLGNRLGIAE